MAIILPLLLGAAIQWLLSHIYYERAAKDLRDEAKALRRKVNMVLEGLTDADLISPIRDANGEIIAVPITIKGRSVTSSRTSASISVDR